MKICTSLLISALLALVLPWKSYVDAQLVEDHPPKTRQSFQQLIHHLEIVSILNEDMSLTILLGDAYKKSPEQVQRRAAELNLQVAREHAEAIKSMAEELEESSPEEAGELQEVARAYAERYRYDASNFEGPES